MNFAEPPVNPKEMSIAEMIDLLEFLEMSNKETKLKNVLNNFHRLTKISQKSGLYIAKKKYSNFKI